MFLSPTQVIDFPLLKNTFEKGPKPSDCSEGPDIHWLIFRALGCFLGPTSGSGERRCQGSSFQAVLQVPFPWYWCPNKFLHPQHHYQSWWYNTKEGTVIAASYHSRRAPPTCLKCIPPSPPPSSRPPFSRHIHSPSDSLHCCLRCLQKMALESWSTMMLCNFLSNHSMCKSWRISTRNT